jgi:hypothetical protein
VERFFLSPNSHCVPGDPSKKLNPELVKDDYERLKIIRKTKMDKKT